MNVPGNSEPLAIDVRFGSVTLEVKLEDGSELIAPLSRYPRLRDGSPAARLNWRITGRGQAIRWPDLDVEIPVAELAGRR